MAKSISHAVKFMNWHGADGMPVQKGGAQELTAIHVDAAVSHLGIEFLEVLAPR